jgi:SAM-dependent methyltransferase
MDFQERTEQRYKADSGRAYHEGKRSIPDAAYPWVARLRAEKIAPYVAASDTVLEYGVGTGWNVAAVECKRRMGFDLAAHLEAEVGEHGIDFVANLQELKADSVDAVICHHVLEHTPNPAKVLEEMRSLLKAGGRLLVFVPLEKERRYRRYDPAEPNHHVYSWNVQTLGNLVADCGFAVDEARTGRFGYDRFAAVWAVRLGLGERGFRLIRRLVHVTAPMLEVRIAAMKTR